ncbi:hypothetical protein ACET3Z_029858 [Daucus carota]
MVNFYGNFDQVEVFIWTEDFAARNLSNAYHIQLLIGSQEGKRMSPLLRLARDDKERASSIDEQWIDGALLLFSQNFISSYFFLLHQNRWIVPCIIVKEGRIKEGIWSSQYKT